MNFWNDRICLKSNFSDNQWCVTFYDSQTVAHQTPLSMGFSRQEYRRGLPFPTPGDLPDPGIEPMSPALRGRFFTTSATREALCFTFQSVQLSFSVMSDSLRPHGLQHARLPHPSLSLRVCSNSCPLNQWCHPTISSSVTPISSCLQSCPTSGSFPVNRLFASGGQSIEASASASVLPMNIQGW